jgi:hypothetical protein
VAWGWERVDLTFETISLKPPLCCSAKISHYFTLFHSFETLSFVI